MHWPVGIHAAVKRQNELDRLNATDTRFGRTEQESISSIITLDVHLGLELEEDAEGEEVGRG